MKNKKIPKKFINDFTMNDKVELIYDYDEDHSDNKESYNIKEENIRMMIEKIKLQENFPLSKKPAATGGEDSVGSSYEYVDKYFYRILSDMDTYNIKGKDVLIIGTSNGWYESFVLAYGGVPHVVEYADVEYNGEQIIYYTPEELTKLDFKFDFCISFSSYEHSGLGRYGDEINPNADLESMSELKNVLKEDGILFLALPIGKDRVVFNIHRIYGSIRLPLLFENWKLVGHSGYWWNQTDMDFKAGHQPIFILKNRNFSELPACCLRITNCTCQNTDPFLVTTKPEGPVEYTRDYYTRLLQSSKMIKMINDVVIYE